MTMSDLWNKDKDQDLIFKDTDFGLRLKYKTRTFQVQLFNSKNTRTRITAAAKGILVLEIF